jgi:flagellin-specific chaperone FliS
MLNDPRKVYGQHEVSTISAEEAMIRLHEKVLDRIDKVVELRREIKDFPAKKLAEEVEKFNELINERGRQIDLVIDSIDAIKNLISEDTPDNLKKQLFETYSFIKLKFLKAVLEEKDRDFNDVKNAVQTLLDGWKKALLPSVHEK